MPVIEQGKAGVLCFVQSRPWDFREAAEQIPRSSMLHSADAATEEAMALSTAGMLAAGWFLLKFVRSEQARETTENPAWGCKSLPYQETHF